MARAPWITDADVDWTDVAAGVDHAAMIAAATDLLFELSGRQYGGRTAVERPTRCVPTCDCHTVTACTCTTTELVLAGPIISITHVKVDGATLTEDTHYAVFDGRVLVRIDGGTWPCCQDLAVPPPGALEVAYTWGRPVPPSGLRAASALTREYALAANPATFSKCRLPRGVGVLTRSGTTIRAKDVPTNKTGQPDLGIAEVTMFLAAKNPTGRRSRPRIASPDVPASAFHTPTG